MAINLSAINLSIDLKKTRDTIKNYEKELKTIDEPVLRQYYIMMICLRKNMYKLDTSYFLLFINKLSRDVFISKLKEVKIEYMDIASDLMEMSKENLYEGLYLEICNVAKEKYEVLEELEKIFEGKE